MTTPIWTETPPTEPGWYWVIEENIGEIYPVCLAPDGSGWWAADHPKARMNAEGWKFGPRIPSPDELAERTEKP